MTRNSDKYIFYLVFAILFVLLMADVIVVLKNIIIGNTDRCLILLLLLSVLLVVIVIVLQLIIYRKCERDSVRDNHITNIIHDCKTPITTINLVCQTLDDVEINSEESLKYYSDIVKAESSKLIIMIENVLNSIRLDNVWLDYDQIVDVHQVITDVVSSMIFLVKNLGGDIVTFLHSDNRYIKGNYDMLSSIIANLINNAIKYTESDSRIIVCTKSVNDNIEISVIDNGIGIEEVDLENIFDKTYRVSSSNTNCSGSGFGLYYVKENVIKMGGNIIVISSFGNGSEFRITLPIVKWLKS